MRIADTSALYAFLVTTDAHHPRARAAIEDPEPIHVPREILVETVDLVAYRFGAAAGPKALDDILRLANVTLAERADFEAVRNLHARAAGRLSLADAVVVQTCRAHGASPLSFDDAILSALS